MKLFPPIRYAPAAGSLIFAILLVPCIAQKPSIPQPNPEFNTEEAMRLMYGNFNRGLGKSHLWLRRAKEGLRSKFNGDLEAWVLFDAPYMEAGMLKHLLVTVARPVGAPSGCHACSYLVGAAVFSQTDNAWTLSARNVALTDAGEFSEDPSVTLQQLGPDHFGFRIEENHSGGGTGIWLSLFDVSDNKITRVFSAAKESSFMSESCWPMPLSQAWEACVEFTSDISLAPGGNPEYYDIALTRRVTESVTKRIPRGTYLLHYRYKSGKYVAESQEFSARPAAAPSLSSLTTSGPYWL
jgi:hypothetical protein